MIGDLARLVEAAPYISDTQHSRMAGEPELTGLAKTFNSVTFTGRANVAKVTLNPEPLLAVSDDF